VYHLLSPVFALPPTFAIGLIITWSLPAQRLRNDQVEASALDTEWWIRWYWHWKANVQGWPTILLFHRKLSLFGAWSNLRSWPNQPWSIQATVHLRATICSSSKEKTQNVCASDLARIPDDYVVVVNSPTRRARVRCSDKICHWGEAPWLCAPFTCIESKCHILAGMEQHRSQY